jgi:carbamoyl-phosphate synthase large subunit
LIELATKAILGQKPDKPNKSLFDLDYIGVKAPQFSFSRLHSADPVIGVEMASTGEVGTLGENYYEAILSSMLAVGYTIPKKNILLSSGTVRSKTEMVNSVKFLLERGYNIYSTGGTYDFLRKIGLETIRIFRPNEKGDPQIADFIQNKSFDLIINIPKDLTEQELEKDYLIRRSAIDGNIPLITNARLASAFIYAFCKMGIEDIAIKSWQEM